MNLVLTGSSSGIGRALATRLLARGHRVWGLARSDQSDFAAEHAGNFRATRCDVADWSQVQRAAAEIATAWPHVDGLVTCAGTLGEVGRTAAADSAKWSATVRVNLDGTFFSLRAFEAQLARAPRRAKIVCFSGGGATKLRANFSAYGVAKTAVVRLVETVAEEERTRALDINAIAPGAINTRLIDEVLALGPAVVGEAEFATAQKQKATGGASLDRALDCVEWLLSPASDGISGRLVSAPWDPWPTLDAHRAELAAGDIYTLRRVRPEDRGQNWSVRPPASAAVPSLKIAVAGLWHLGSVTAACLARYFQVTGLDFDAATIAQLSRGAAPVLEPGLNQLLAAGLAAKRLSFTTDAQAACTGADILWLTYDTPVDDNDASNIAWVKDQFARCATHLRPGTLVIVSSQLPVGTCRQFESAYPQLRFACSPENLRLGRALETFEKQDRVIVGLRDATVRPLLEQLFAPFTPKVHFMRTESAEMLKHALNSFLALSVSFINEVASLCETVGADAHEVAFGLKSEPRIGVRAYLKPGSAFAGGTLARDVVTLTALGDQRQRPLTLIPAIKRSNDLHRGWAMNRLQTRFGELRGKTIALLGLTYTPNTDTLRRSSAIELCVDLLAAGARVQAFDPVVRQLPPEVAAAALRPSIAEAITGADAAVVCTEWPEFRQAPWSELVRLLHSPPIVIDANRFLDAEVKNIPQLEHLSVGRSA